jgi:hypothetical protein
VQVEFRRIKLNRPSLDAIAEFRTLTSNYSADYGLSSGCTLSMVFKSGTKDFHGGMWEFFRNDALDAANFFTNASGGSTAELRYNVYGFNLGGPVILPHYNKDRNKTFFFYNEEWRKPSTPIFPRSSRISDSPNLRVDVFAKRQNCSKRC